jgi:glycosyltransferase involved in cell wall biosynthesis
MVSSAPDKPLIARIAHIVPTDRIAYLLLRGRLSLLQKAGFDVTVICGDLGYGDKLRESGLQVLHIPFAREIDVWTDLRCAGSLLTTLRRERFDIVHSHNPKGGLLGPVIARLARTPVVTHTVHGFLFNENSRGLHHLLAHGAERWTALWCDHLLFQSAEDYTYARKLNLKREDELHLVGNGIDPGFFDPKIQAPTRNEKRGALGIEPEHIVVGTVGRFVEEKGYLEFFEMAARIARERAQARFLVAGSSEKEQSDALDLEALIARHGIADRCVLIEPPVITRDIYACMDIFVLASYREGISRSLLEAAAMSLPLVASDIRGCREVVEDGRNGRLFPLKEVDSLVAAVESLIDDDSGRRRMGGAAREMVTQNYTEAATSERVAASYEKMLASRRS